MTIKFYVAGKAVGSDSVAVRELGFGVPVTNLPTVKYECCVPIADALRAIERPFAALMLESKEELHEGILEPEYTWLVTDWHGGDWPRFMAQIRAVVEDNQDSLSGPQLETVLGFLDVCECALALDSFCDAMFENECIASPDTRAIVGRIAKELGMNSAGEYERLLGGPA